MPLDELATEALRAVEDLLARAAERLRPRVRDGGALSVEKLEREQHAAHGLAWLATYVEAIREMAGYARRMQAEGRYGETEALLTQIGLGEYLAQIFGGIAMNQGEIVRLADFGLSAAEIAAARTEAVEYPISRVLCDARILNIFEGAAEIQAQVIARRLLEGGN